jgi:hypothetical protein
MSLVHPGRRLQRRPLLAGLTRMRKAIRMHFALQRTVSLIEQCRVEAETLGQAKELEMVAGKIDHRTNRLVREARIGGPAAILRIAGGAAAILRRAPMRRLSAVFRR